MHTKNALVCLKMKTSQLQKCTILNLHRPQSYSNKTNFTSNTWRLIILLVTPSSFIYKITKWADEIIPQRFFLRINSTVHCVVALHSFVWAMTLASIALHFQGNSLGHPTESADLHSRSHHPSPQRLMKKTSSGTKKVTRLVRRDLAVSLFPPWQVLMRQGWLVPWPGGDDGQDGPPHSITSPAASGNISSPPPPTAPAAPNPQRWCDTFITVIRYQIRKN